MTLMEEPLFMFMAQYAYEPLIVYGSIVLLMLASSFGLPIPEEVTLISAGIIAYMGSNPDIFPPPYPNAHGVSVFGTAVVAFLAVFFSDLLIYMLGRVFGRRWMESKRFEKVISPEVISRIERWTRRYGMWACGIFRFTPGIRFPGHMACGALKLPLWKFALVDGIAALISVPTQIYLVATYGESILSNIKQFKFLLLIVIVSFLLFFALRKLILWYLTRNGGAGGGVIAPPSNS